MFRSSFTRGLIAAIAALTATAGTARADLQVRLTQSGFASSVVVSVAGANPSGSASGTYGSFSFTTLAAASNSPGSFFSQLFSSTTTITNTSGSAKTLMIEIGSTGFTSPLGATTIHSHIGSTVGVTGGGTLLSFQSYANNDNGQFSTTGFTSGLQTTNITTANSSDNSDATGGANMTSGYSIVQIFFITLNAGGSINFSTNTNLVTPEPATITGALVGLSSLGLFGLRRRKPVSLA